MGVIKGVGGRAEVVEISEDNEWKTFMRISKFCGWQKLFRGTARGGDKP